MCKCDQRAPLTFSSLRELMSSFPPQETAAPAPGDVLPALCITDLTVSGGAVARHEGRVVFLDRGLPDDIVSATVTSVKKRITHATVTDIVTPSPHRVEPWCPHFAECGGCTWQDLALPSHAEWKARHLRETLMRIGGVREPGFLGLIASPKTRAFRNKMTFAFGLTSAGQTTLGLRQRGTHAVVEVTDCMLQAPLAMKIVARVRAFVQDADLPSWDEPQGYLRFLIVRIPEFQPEGTTTCIVECITGPEPRGRQPDCATAVRALARELVEGELGVSGFVHSERKHPAQVSQGERMLFSLGQVNYEEHIGELALQVPYDSFLQTNTEAAALLYEQVARFAGLTGTECLWDVYCGVGGIGLSVAAHAASVHGFDWQESSITAARKNSARLGHSHCRFVAGPLPVSLSKETSVPDVIILDPPRAGMEPDVAKIIAASPARRIVYVSCDVATQARDISRLGPEWQVEKSVAVDMFPYTPHGESIVLLTRVAQ